MADQSDDGAGNHAVRPSGAAVKSDRAMARWKVLARGLLEGRTVSGSDSTIRQFPGYGLFHVEKEPTEESSSPVPSPSQYTHAIYRTDLVPDMQLSVSLRGERSKISMEQLRGFDNTGCVCLWPSEEVLAHYCVATRDQYRGKRVCELAAGMSGLAGIALAVSGDCTHVSITDGNELCADIIAVNVEKNRAQFGGTEVSSTMLRWGEHVHEAHSFDVVVAADCLFLEQYHDSLLVELDHLLCEDGYAIIIAPQRLLTMKKFSLKAEQCGWQVEQEHRFDKTVFEAHQKALSEKDTNGYDVRYHMSERLVLRRGAAGQ